MSLKCSLLTQQKAVKENMKVKPKEKTKRENQKRKPKEYNKRFVAVFFLFFI